MLRTLAKLAFCVCVSTAHVTASSAEENTSERPSVSIDVIALGPEKSGSMQAKGSVLEDGSGGVLGPSIDAGISKDGRMTIKYKWVISTDPPRDSTVTLTNLGGGSCLVQVKTTSPIRLSVPTGVSVLCPCCMQPYTEKRAFVVDRALRLQLSNMPKAEGTPTSD